MRRKNEALYSTQMPSSQYIDKHHHMTYRKISTVLSISLTDVCLSLSYLMLFIFSWGEIYSEFFLSLSKRSIFWWWLKVTSKNWFENQKPRQGKSHRLTNFLVTHCSTKVGIFVCSEKSEKHGRSQGWLIHWKSLESCKIDTHTVWGVWIIQNNYTELCDFYMNQTTKLWHIFVTDIFFVDTD